MDFARSKQATAREKPHPAQRYCISFCRFDGQGKVISSPSSMRLKSSSMFSSLNARPSLGRSARKALDQVTFVGVGTIGTSVKYRATYLRDLICKSSIHL